MQTHTILWPMSYSRKVSGVSETHSSMTTMNLWGFGKKKKISLELRVQHTILFHIYG